MNKSKICVIGGGGWGKNHINTLNRLGHLYGIIDSNKDILNAHKKINANCKFFTSIDDALSFGFDGYVIATPAETHYSIAKKLINLSQNVLIEKPVCLSSNDAKELKTLALKNDVFIMGGHLLLFHPAFLKMKEMIKNNKIGNIKYIYSNRVNFGRVRSHENALWSLAPHDLSLLLFFNDYEITNLSYKGSQFLDRDIDDACIATFNFSNKVNAHIFISWLHPFKEHKFVIIGDKGMLVYEDSSLDKDIILYKKSVIFDKASTLEPILKNEEKETIQYEKLSPLDEQLMYFVHSIENDNKKLDNFVLSINVVNALEKLGEVSK